MPTIVVFNKDGSVRINEGANEADFKGLDYLVDPKFPRGVPPHEWKKHPDGYIIGTPPPKSTKSYQMWVDMGLLLGGAVVGFLITRFFLR